MANSAPTHSDKNACGYPMDRRHQYGVRQDFETAWKFLQIELSLSGNLSMLNHEHKPPYYIYDPLTYALRLHCSYLEKYLTGPKDVLFLGMNPGPFGMTQSGIPFGDVEVVKNWLGISGEVCKPYNFTEHPKLPIVGLECDENEGSGTRFWGLFQGIFGTPENFFTRRFVHNYCPLTFLNSRSGTNLTPEDIKDVPYKEALMEACDDALLHIVRLLKPKLIVGVGRFAEARANDLKSQGIIDVSVHYLVHPSPRNAYTDDSDWVPDGRLHEELRSIGALYL